MVKFADKKLTYVLILHGSRAAEPHSYPQLTQAVNFFPMFLSIQGEPEGLYAVCLDFSLRQIYVSLLNARESDYSSIGSPKRRSLTIACTLLSVRSCLSWLTNNFPCHDMF